MDNGDKSWTGLRRSTDEYIRGVNDFLDKAFERASQGSEILCPCKKCSNCQWHYRNVVEDHLVCYGFIQGYTKWIFHGKKFSSRNNPHPSNDDEGSNMHDDIDGLLHDTFRNVEGDMRHEEGVREGPSEDAKRFFKLVGEGKEELYLGCENFSKLSFTIRLFLFKCIHGLSNVAFSNLLDLLKEAFPFAQLPESFHKAKNMIQDLGLHYEKIHACPNDCMLFWNENENNDNCSVCGTSRWKNVVDGLTNASSKIPAKVLRRPADGEAWKTFDFLHKDFSRDPHNVRLGLSSDGTVGDRGRNIDAKSNQRFQMRTALLWTVSDFPALAMLSGWSTKGRLVAVRKVLPKNVSLALIRLGNFFRAICRKVIKRRDLDKMQSEILKLNVTLKRSFLQLF
ncbi:uncharacterized protein [Nicotiana sylvestris]|uniref:uncharacterized protein n=1 Tax=Nicotiana sylvestris TaxID=4096 RepID=UPI00388CEB98